MLTIRKSGFKGIGNAYTGSSQALSNGMAGAAYRVYVG
jgi:hypothetical protein